MILHYWVFKKNCKIFSISQFSFYIQCIRTGIRFYLPSSFFPSFPPLRSHSSRLPLIKSIAQDEGVLFVENTFEGLWQNTDLMADMVHPNDDGYAIVCDRLKEAVAPHFVLK